MKCVPWRWGQFQRRKTTWHQWPIRNQGVNRLPVWPDIDSVRRWVKFPVDKRNIGSRHPDSGSVWPKTNNNRFLQNCFLNSHADGVVVLLFSVIRHPSIRMRIQRSREPKTNATGLTVFWSFLWLWPWNDHQGTLISCLFLFLYMNMCNVALQGLMGIQSRHIYSLFSVRLCCHLKAKWMGGSTDNTYKPIQYLHPTHTELRVVPDREHIRRTSNNILRLPRTFSPAKRCTGDCKWIREVSSDPHGIAVPLFIWMLDDKPNNFKIAQNLLVFLRGNSST